MVDRARLIELQESVRNPDRSDMQYKQVVADNAGILASATRNSHVFPTVPDYVKITVTFDVKEGQKSVQFVFNAPDDDTADLWLADQTKIYTLSRDYVTGEGSLTEYYRRGEGIARIDIIGDSAAVLVEAM